MAWDPGPADFRPPEASVATVGILAVAVVLGLTAGVLSAEGTAKEWPPQAAQVLATLLVAAVVEQHTLPAKLSWYGLPMAAVIAGATFGAILITIVAAAGGDRLTALEGGIVNGAIAALGLIVVLRLLWRLWPN